MAQWPLPMTRVIKIGSLYGQEHKHAKHGGATCVKGRITEQKMKEAFGLERCNDGGNESLPLALADTSDRQNAGHISLSARGD
jgi:hypothetical protein